MAHQVVWFDIPCKDLDRAIRFYSSVLGYEVQKQNHGDFSIGLLTHDHNDVGGCLAPADADSQPSEKGPLLYLNCEGRLDQAVSAAEGGGGKVLTPKHAIGPYGFRAIVLDSEGNRVALHSMS